MDADRQSTGMLFHALHRAHHKRVGEEQTAQGLGDLGSPMLLLSLYRMEQKSGRPPSQRDLAERMRLSPASVAVSLKSMERENYVTRHQDERDARLNRIVLTPRGRDAIQACHETFFAVDRQMLSGFTPEEIEQLDGYFRRMLHNLHADEMEARCTC